MALNEEMNKRDMFASQALAGGLQQEIMDESAPSCNANWWYSGECIAKRAYEIADAMMEASDS